MSGRSAVSKDSGPALSGVIMLLMSKGFPVRPNCSMHALCLVHQNIDQTKKKNVKNQLTYDIPEDDIQSSKKGMKSKNSEDHECQECVMASSLNP